MKYGFIIPGGDLDTIIESAVQAEKAGWDGVFYWDGIYIEQVPLMYDAWTVLAAMALKTRKIRLGAMLTAVNRRRPWKLARESMTVDHLSKGRLIMPVGLGAMEDGGYSKVGEPMDRKARAELLDESLEILTGLWSGAPFSYKGKHYEIRKMKFRPTPIQRPRIPIWVVGAWPRMKSINRAIKYDGIIPTKKLRDGSFADMTTNDIRAIRTFVRKNREGKGPFEIVYEGQTRLNDRKKAARIVNDWAEAGATWWIESRWAKPDEALPRIKQGPPKPTPVLSHD